MKIVLPLLVFVAHVAAFWRMPCRSQTGIGRLDPLMDAGEVSPHVHTITGGGGFGFNTDFNTLRANNCTACEVTQDHSAYWTPTLNFMYDNGTTVMVEQVGGMLAYYLYLLSNIVAFEEGFQMVAGNPFIRNFTGPYPDTPLSFWPTDPVDQFFLEQRAIGFNCLNYDRQGEPSLYRHVLPTKEYMDANCIDGLRLEIAFPSCGNGSIDSSDHKSHMAYPSLVKEGNCPKGFDIHYPFLFYETIWATNAFVGESGQFLLSYGDPVGTGYHGDFIMGWESADFLQTALDTCQNQSGEIQDCPLFDIQTDEEAAQCTFEMPEVLKGDMPTGPRSGLAVDVPIQYGPAMATTYPIAGRSGQATTTIAPTKAPSTFSKLPTLSYSAANATEISTAQGGIVVAMFSPHGACAAPATVMEAPAPTAVGEMDEAATVSHLTSGGQVMDLFIDEVTVTVTTTASPTGSNKHSHHMHRHTNKDRL